MQIPFYYIFVCDICVYFKYKHCFDLFFVYSSFFYKQDIYDFNVIAYNLTPIFMYFIPLKLESIT